MHLTNEEKLVSGVGSEQNERHGLIVGVGCGWVVNVVPCSSTVDTTAYQNAFSPFSFVFKLQVWFTRSKQKKKRGHVRRACLARRVCLSFVLNFMLSILRVKKNEENAFCRLKCPLNLGCGGLQGGERWLANHAVIT